MRVLFARAASEGSTAKRSLYFEALQKRSGIFEAQKMPVMNICERIEGVDFKSTLPLDSLLMVINLAGLPASGCDGAQHSQGKGFILIIEPWGHSGEPPVRRDDPYPFQVTPHFAALILFFLTIANAVKCSGKFDVIPRGSQIDVP